MIGYQAREDWMGVEVLTLADVFPPEPRAVIVGLNPAPASVVAGHYYQGRVGQRQLRKLADAGLFALPDGEPHFEAAALRSGVGFTDIVKRASVGEGDVAAAEITHGRSILEDKLAGLRVPLVVCVFRHPMVALLGREGSPGMQRDRTSWGAQVFRMPGPFEARESSDRVMAELISLLQA